jgi:hypothetical protein
LVRENAIEVEMQEKNLITEGDAQLEDQQSFIEREISP